MLHTRPFQLECCVHQVPEDICGFAEEEWISTLTQTTLSEFHQVTDPTGEDHNLQVREFLTLLNQRIDEAHFDLGGHHLVHLVLQQLLLDMVVVTDNPLEMVVILVIESVCHHTSFVNG